MSNFPTHITHTQIHAAAEALGLPADMVSDLHISAKDGLTVTLIVRGRNGRPLIHGDDTLKATIHVPIRYDTPGNEDPQQP